MFPLLYFKTLFLQWEKMFIYWAIFQNYLILHFTKKQNIFLIYFQTFKTSQIKSLTVPPSLRTPALEENSVATGRTMLSTCRKERANFVQTKKREVPPRTGRATGRKYKQIKVRKDKQVVPTFNIFLQPPSVLPVLQLGGRSEELWVAWVEKQQ